MPYKEYKPDSTDKVVIDDVEIEVHKFTDKENIYWCGKCGEACPIEFFYINDCALCSNKCKDEYLDDVRAVQSSDETRQLQKDLDDEIAAQVASAGAPPKKHKGKSAKKGSKKSP